MTTEINPWEIRLKVYKTGERGRDLPVISYSGEFDVRGVIRGLREENNKLPIDEWTKIKTDLYNNLFEILENKLVEYSNTLFGEDSIWETGIFPVNGIPEYSFGQGSIYVTINPKKSSIKRDEVKHLLSSAITAAIRDCIDDIKRKDTIKTKHYPVIREYF